MGYGRSYLPLEVKFLSKNLQKFIRVTTGNRHVDKLKAKANCFRKLMVFKKELEEEIANLEQSLIKEQAEIYFIDDKQKVVINKETGKVVVSQMVGKRDMTKAIKQGEKKETK